VGFLHPELLILAIPVGLIWWRTRHTGSVTASLRALVGALLLLALAGPYTVTGDDGRDLVIVVDRSRSMPPESLASAMELIDLADQERREGDEIHVIGFGAVAHVEHSSRQEGRFEGFARNVDADGSDLGGALEMALTLIGRDRKGAVLLLSDGENNGRDPIPLARRAFARGVRVDVRDFHRPTIADLSVERIDLPGEVAVGEPFQFNVWVRADRHVKTDFRLRRGDVVLSSGERVFEPGLNRLVFRDVLERAGVAEFEVDLGDVQDRVPENNRGLGAVRASGAPAILVLNDDGREDTLVRALRRARLPVAVTTPEAARLDAVGLSGFRGVILENVAASRLGPGMRALRDFVLDRGGGLLMTGGKASFGVGGYYLSPLDEVLPVSMELRQEHRKLSVAMAIALDRSGSMSAPVASGQTKMDLANLGTSAAVELLSPNDQVAIIAVDSTQHVMVEMTPVTNPAEIVAKVKRIESMGGGIFVKEALDAAIRQLDRTQVSNRHIILFSDAADSERPGDSVEMIKRLNRQAGLTLSVIALGSETDPDATLLKDLAAAGGGDVHFTTSPEELPRLFAMDTMKISRSTFIEDVTNVQVLPDLFGLGAMPTESFPALAGYNLSYLRPSATAGMVTVDEYKAPIFAFAHEGLGRTAAYAGQVGGSFGGEIVAWPGFGEFFVTVGRWLVGNEEPEEFFASVRREGRDAVLSVEIDADAPLPPDTSELVAVMNDPDGGRTELVLEKVGEFLFEARTTLSRSGVSLGTVKLDDERFVSLPPVVLPYSPEFERSPDADRGARLLRRLTRESGGELGVTVGSFFRGARSGSVWRLISRELMIVALLILLVEIAGRRLSLWNSLRVPAAVTRVADRTVSALRARRNRPRAVPRVAGSPPTNVPGEPGPAPEQVPSQAPAQEPAAAPKKGVGSALTRARRAADRKLGR